MSKDPAFLFYSQDFIVGVQTMNFEDRGKYITILAQMHQQGRMNEETIRFLVGSVSDNLKGKFKIDDNGFWYNERLESEAKKRAEFTESRRINGSKGGRPKKGSKAKGKPSGFHMDNHMGNENENENEKEPKKKHLFIDSPYYDKDVFIQEMRLDPKYANEDLDYHYESAKLYSEQNNAMYVNWIAAVKNWIRKDQKNREVKEAKPKINF